MQICIHIHIPTNRYKVKQSYVAAASANKPPFWLDWKPVLVVQSMKKIRTLQQQNTQKSKIK